jgi:hypothetical protein
MRLVLHHLYSMHPKLQGSDLARYGGLALQRAGHTSPVTAGVVHDGLESTAGIEWLSENLSALDVLDSNRVTEDGAEAVALTYVNAKAGWIVKRRLQRFERGDWLMQNKVGSMAVEVSGTATGDPLARLEVKKRQVAGCSLPVERLAVVGAFAKPSIMAGSV